MPLPVPCARFRLRRLLASCLLLLTGLTVGPALGGCQILGVAAAKMPPPTVPAAYDRLAGETAAVWVWVDPAADIDYPTLSLQVASRLQANLEKARDEGNGRQKRTLEAVNFTIPPASIVRYQKKDPSLNTVPIEQLAPRLEVGRLIYVEIVDFTTQGGAAAGLWRGVADVNLSVIEVDRETGAAETAYREQAIRIFFPPDGPKEGSSTLGAERTYYGLVARIADQLTLRFIPHPAEES